MRPLRGLIACLGMLLFVTILITARRKNSDEYAGSTPAARSRLRALFSFHTPESLFPPSAIISLTDDNSTFFLARPAAYGTSLPSSGLSGQLWIGSGFNEEGAGQRSSTINAEGELGCSDIPGWPYFGDGSGPEEKGGTSQESKSRGRHRNPKEAPKVPIRAAMLEASRQGGGKGKSGAPSMADGTDDHLHWPLKGAPLVAGAKVLHEPHPSGKDAKDKGHADIQSIQESAEIAGKVVLLARGGCGFLEKTKWVQRRGGVALIVGDNVKGSGLITMYANGDTSNVTIPSVFTSHTSAHLLSSLIPPGGYFVGRPLPDDYGMGKIRGGNSKSKGKKHTPSGQGTGGGSGKTVSSSTKSKSSAKPKSEGGVSWLGRLAALFGIGGGDGLPESRRPPNSGRNSWVQQGGLEEDSAAKQAGKAELQRGSNVVKKPNGPGDGFVIGVHDWRDADLVALQQEDGQDGSSTTSTGAVPASTKSKQSDVKAAGFAGGNALPGSGRYSIPSQGDDQFKSQEKDGEDGEVEGGRWYNKLFGSEVEELSEEEALGFDRSGGSSGGTASPPSPESGPPPLVDTPNPREGLWVTITPTTMSSSPFFDTLLVLVISPLVTLTVVYALLLLRARIQRRRWRAPKSVVERLPVRIYHTMSSSSTSSSSQAPSSESSSSASPPLQPDPLSSASSTLSRTRPRSRTTTDVGEGAGLTLERQRGDLSSRYEKKRYRGKQIECAVCLEEYVDGQSQVMSLPCGHEFHAECITPWLTTRRRTCPICKGDVVRSMAAGASGDTRSNSPSPAREGRQVSRTHSLDRSGTPHSETPLLRRRGDDLERGRGGASWSRGGWSWPSIRELRFWDRRTRRDGSSDAMDRDR